MVLKAGPGDKKQYPRLTNDDEEKDGEMDHEYPLILTAAAIPHKIQDIPQPTK